MEYAKTCDLLVSQHAEDHRLTCGAQMHEGRVSTKLGLRGWPREAEEIIVARDVFVFNSDPGAANDESFSTTSVIPRIANDLTARGMKLDAAMFKRAGR